MITREIKTLIYRAVSESGYSASGDSVKLEHPGVSEYGDFSTNVAMRLAKEVNKNPREIAEEIIAKMQKSPLLEKCEVAGPGFINIFLNERALLRELARILEEKDKYGRPEKAGGKKISVEHTQVNPNKEPHVGHLRNAVIGDALTRILEFFGNRVVTLYYQNDLGQQVASIMLAHKKQWVRRENFPTLIAWASRAYADAESRMSESEELRREKEEIQMKIANQTTSEAKEARGITDEILKETLLTLQKLQISYDCVVRESDIVQAMLWEQTFEILKKNPAFYLAEEGDKKGCWLIKVPGSEDKIIVRSNGVPNYTGVDIANHLWKFGKLPDFAYEKLDWGTQERELWITSTSTDAKGSGPWGEGGSGHGADAILNIIDTTQTYPQQSVIEALRVLGFAEEAENYHHVNYGFVYLSPKTARDLGFEVGMTARQVKMSGRKGTVVSVETFLMRIESVLKEKFGVFETLSAVRNGAIKFELLKYDTYQDVVFDLEAALDVNGYSGPYVQYAYTRARGVLGKARNESSPSTSTESNVRSLPTDLDSARVSKEELEVMRKLYQFPEVVERTAKEFSPHHLCTYLFELAKTFNAFYNAHRIIGSGREAELIKLTRATAQVLKNGLFLLGIDAPEKM